MQLGIHTLTPTLMWYSPCPAMPSCSRTIANGDTRAKWYVAAAFGCAALAYEGGPSSFAFVAGAGAPLCLSPASSVSCTRSSGTQRDTPRRARRRWGSSELVLVLEEATESALIDCALDEEGMGDEVPMSMGLVGAIAGCTT